MHTFENPISVAFSRKHCRDYVRNLSFIRAKKKLWHCKKMNDRTGQHKSTSASLPVCRYLGHISESVNNQEILVWLSQVHKMNGSILHWVIVALGARIVYPPDLACLSSTQLDTQFSKASGHRTR